MVQRDAHAPWAPGLHSAYREQQWCSETLTLRGHLVSILHTGSSSGAAVKLLGCGAGGTGFDSLSRHFDF